MKALLVFQQVEHWKNFNGTWMMLYISISKASFLKECLFRMNIDKHHGNMTGS